MPSIGQPSLLECLNHRRSVSIRECAFSRSSAPDVAHRNHRIRRRGPGASFLFLMCGRVSRHEGFRYQASRARPGRLARRGRPLFRRREPRATRAFAPPVDWSGRPGCRRAHAVRRPSTGARATNRSTGRAHHAAGQDVANVLEHAMRPLQFRLPLPLCWQEFSSGRPVWAPPGMSVFCSGASRIFFRTTLPAWKQAASSRSSCDACAFIAFSISSTASPT